MYKLWMFDFDNTIARLEPVVDWPGARKILEPYLRSVGAPAELFEKFPRRNLPLYDAYRTLTLADPNRAQAQERLRHASEIIETAELAGVDRAEPLNGAIELLKSLKAGGATIAIVTSNSSKTVRRWFDRHPDASLDAVVGRDSLLALKPAPDMLNRALESSSADPSEAAYVGDSEGDVRAAHSCGVRFYGIAATDNLPDQLITAGTTEIFDSPAALATHLKL